jgi:hypothetical protein
MGSLGSGSSLRTARSQTVAPVLYPNKGVLAAQDTPVDRLETLLEDGSQLLELLADRPGGHLQAMLWKQPCTRCRGSADRRPASADFRRFGPTLLSTICLT